MLPHPVHLTRVTQNRTSSLNPPSLISIAFNKMPTGQTDTNHKTRVLTCSLCASPTEVAYSVLRDRLFDGKGEWSIARCTSPACGLMCLDPQPTAAQLASAYQTYYTHVTREEDSLMRRFYLRLRAGYLASRFYYNHEHTSIWWMTAGRIFGLAPHRGAAFDASVMWLPAKPGGRLLEIGCGAGENLAHLAQLGWQVEGIEPDPKAASVARSRGLAITEGSLNAHSFSPASFDAIVLSHVIEHLNNPLEVTRICRTLLRPGGLLVMLTPNADAFGHRRYRENWLHLDPPRHLFIFNITSIRRLAALAGFADCQCFSTLRDANWTLAGSRALRDIGRYKIGSLPLVSRLSGMYLLYIEWLRMHFNPNCGEEIVLILQQPDE